MEGLEGQRQPGEARRWQLWVELAADPNKGESTNAFAGLGDG